MKHMLNILIITVLALVVIAAIAQMRLKRPVSSESYREYEYRKPKRLYEPRSLYIPKTYAFDGTPYN